jgi:hypothetical protein
MVEPGIEPGTTRPRGWSTNRSDAVFHVVSFCDRRAMLPVSVCQSVHAGQHVQCSPYLRFLNLVCRQMAGLLEQRIVGPHLTNQ